MFRKLVYLSLIAFFSCIQPANAETKRVLFQGQSKTLFDITIFIDKIYFVLSEKTDAFTGKKDVLKVRGTCDGGMEIAYKGEEDFIFEEEWAFAGLNLLYEDVMTTERSTYLWTIKTDVIHKSGDRIPTRDFLPNGSDLFYENPSQRQIDEIKSNSLYRCNHKNIIGIRDNRPMVHIKFRSGRTLVGQSFWDHARVSIVEVEPKFIEY